MDEQREAPDGPASKQRRQSIQTESITEKLNDIYGFAMDVVEIRTPAPRYYSAAAAQVETDEKDASSPPKAIVHLEGANLRKKYLLHELNRTLASSSMVAVLQHHSLSVEEMMAFRQTLKAKNLEFTIVRNKLTRKALAGVHRFLVFPLHSRLKWQLCEICCPCFANDMACIANNMAYITNDMACIANDMACIANDMACIANDMACIANDMACIANDMACIADDMAYIANDMACIANDMAYIANGMAGIANDMACIANDMACIANDMACIANDMAYIANDMACIANDMAYIANNMAGIANDMISNKRLNPQALTWPSTAAFTFCFWCLVILTGVS
ncbi:hypothetical protein SARC_00950 [Sphaeroforma arctica JP610]|uniref:Uncharacterized protein n=1 Tax=Sphaeroforma arctica JP610 TaxID=667725 RepID=A0A0L0GD12_9EUKA|nr:hypothetical protein SARC_00950 [Sphaeroforma arctica JP610]KNC86905.1 hypothetical protein SARC_00950 [Sphaeroforma arctica JP610]|eukprot:XP_014160807.1 hypothetical protein SARC_00950 [Sphaeroforma arctica JP610]